MDRLGIARPTFYRWYDLYQRFGEDALEDLRSGPRRAWNRIPEKVQDQILEMALERCELISGQMKECQSLQNQIWEIRHKEAQLIL